MTERITVKTAAERLRAADRVWILAHQFPDGDTLGSGYALCRALRAMGKQAQVLCSDPIPEKYDYMTVGLSTQEFEPAFICAVDVADAALLGETLQPLAERVDPCIDHHASHREFEKQLLLCADCGANAMIVLQVIEELGVSVDAAMAATVCDDIGARIVIPMHYHAQDNAYPIETVEPFVALMQDREYSIRRLHAYTREYEPGNLPRHATVGVYEHKNH